MLKAISKAESMTWKDSGPCTIVRRIRCWAYIDFPHDTIRNLFRRFGMGEGSACLSQVKSDRQLAFSKEDIQWEKTIRAQLADQAAKK
jgi:hypothetical protein